jgi:hypothetical protein
MLAAALERFAAEAFAALREAEWEEADGGEAPIEPARLGWWS